ncbi:protein naked cuticle homolog 2-like isoform X1 [Mytilus edulis]|uniref:protein naked cuticle homolog 2-like isoform X1 n=2 Tax=Mytilus edulis TaxID=6550 RepID=UPI0039F12749
MGKQASKHAECFLVNGQFNKALMEEQILKQTKTGFNLANYNLNNSVTELSVSLEDKGGESVPLRVELPPPKMESHNNKLLTLDNNLEKPDQSEDKDKTGTETDNRLSIEEFECGVQFESTEKNKQEWSFTLYDFDGQGKVTKEDLSSLLKALYDAVGSSIKIPSNGTKTLKLRLTVGPDGSLSPCHKGSPKSKENKDKCKDTPKVKDTSKLQKVNNLTQANLQMPLKQCNSEKQGHCYGNNLSQCQSPKRLPFTSQEHQQLAELVQENMERNHIKQLRRHHSDCRGNTHEHSHHKRRHRGHCSKNNGATNINERAKECQDRRNYYLDLAGIEHTAVKEQNNTLCEDTQHQRSRSNDLPHKCDNVKKEVELLPKHLDLTSRVDHIRSKSFDPQEIASRSPKGHHKTISSSLSPSKSHKFRPLSLPMNIEPAIASHYHRRHRQREKNHDLAMQQVAEWIEKEHTIDKDGEKVIVQRHEHHHIHEHHHHHHYHHYHEA